jgi:hypothetical protein
MIRFHSVQLFNFEECLIGFPYIKDGDVGSSLSETLRKSKTTSPGAAGDKCCASFERELFTRQLLFHKQKVAAFLPGSFYQSSRDDVI